MIKFQIKLIDKINEISLERAFFNWAKDNYKDFSYYDLLIVIFYCKLQLLLCKLLLTTVFINNLSLLCTLPYKDALYFIFKSYMKPNFIKKKLNILLNTYFLLPYKNRSQKWFLYNYKIISERYADT